MNDPRTDPLALELDGLLAAFHKAVWDNTLDEDCKIAYDEVGNTEAEAIQAYCRRTQSQWQPMETAPKDRPVLLRLGFINEFGPRKGKPAVMIGQWTQWVEWIGANRSVPRGDPFWELQGGGRRSDGPDPTPDGWMELPE